MRQGDSMTERRMTDEEEQFLIETSKPAPTEPWSIRRVLTGVKQSIASLVIALFALTYLGYLAYIVMDWLLFPD